MRTLLSVLGMVALVLVVVWLLSAAGLVHYRFFAPKYEAARREVFVNTASYVQGKAQFLTRLKGEWELSSDEAHRSALCRLARHEATTVDVNLLPADIRYWECVK